MRIFLQQPVNGTDPTGYLQLTLQPDLFGGWELLRESGQIGRSAKLHRQFFADQAQAEAAFEKARDSELKRGYQITYTRGVPPR